MGSSEENKIEVLFLDSIKKYYANLHDAHVRLRDQLFGDQADACRILDYLQDAPNCVQTANSQIINYILARLNAEPINPYGLHKTQQYKTDWGILNLESIGFDKNYPLDRNIYCAVWFPKPEVLDA